MKLPIDRDTVRRYLPFLGLEGAKEFRGGWNSKCPYCKRIGKNTKEKKFFILTSKGVNVYCHKCGASKSFYSFLEDFSPSTLESIRSEAFLLHKPKIELAAPPAPEPKKEPPTGLLSGLIPLADSPDGLAYWRGRNLPERFLSSMFFTDNYKNYLSEKGYMSTGTYKTPDPRIVIPYLNEKKQVTHIQGRSILKTEKLRYISITIREDSPKIWGLDLIDKSKTVYITEGVFDAIYIDNCIAFGSAYCDPQILKNLGITDYVFCMDRDIETNLSLRRTANTYLRSGAKMFFFPRNLPATVKDFNDLAKIGWEPDQINNLVRDNTFTGLSAKAKLAIIGGTFDYSQA